MPKASVTQTVIKGTAKNDILEGGVEANRLVGGAGDDRLIAAWNDLAGIPTGTLIFDGGTGTDTLDFSKLDRAIGIDLYFGPYIYTAYNRELYGDRVSFNPNSGDRLAGAISGIENIIGSEFSDYLQGSSGNNVIDGRGGDDYISSQRGADVVIGGAGDDYIVLGSHSSTLTGDNPADSAVAGNDTFVSIGNDAGIYSTVRITDFDTREGVDDNQYDRIHISTYQQVSWSENAAGELILLRYTNGTPIGEIVFSNLTLADASKVAVYSINPNTDDFQPVPLTVNEAFA